MRATPNLRIASVRRFGHDIVARDVRPLAQAAQADTKSARNRIADVLSFSNESSTANPVLLSLWLGTSLHWLVVPWNIFEIKYFNLDVLLHGACEGRGGEQAAPCASHLISYMLPHLNSWAPAPTLTRLHVAPAPPASLSDEQAPSFLMPGMSVALPPHLYFT